ncbi:MAG: DEAD/DEAH box helicase [Clostridiales bacterium]|nr:DEAD/DEAH box helicase [Clostridiales bacterium]
MQFENLNIIPPILKALESEGYTQPTLIQEQAIPILLSGKDLLGCAQTGTGKTAAFAIPILQQLYEEKLTAAKAASSSEDRLMGESLNLSAPHARETPRGLPKKDIKNRNASSDDAPSSSKRQLHHRCKKPSIDPAHISEVQPIRALILTPTRELSLQIGESFGTYGKNLNLKCTVIYGGVSQASQTLALRQGVDILVATPGRLLDLVNQRYINLHHIRLFVLDEADRMLDMGFAPDVRRIIAMLPKVRQSMMFSATMPIEIMRLVDTVLTDPEEVTVTPVSSTVDKIEQYVYHLARINKRHLLVHLLQDLVLKSVLVFSRTKHGAERIYRELRNAGVNAATIHGDKSQPARQQALGDFKKKKVRVLVATDIAARGIDVEEISHVINFDVPDVAETYVHRIGRTGRAGMGGVAISFCDEEEKPNLRDIRRLTGSEITVITDHPFNTEPEQMSPPMEVTKIPFSNSRSKRRSRRPGTRSFG